MRRSIVISGAGIAGLTLALTLARHGCDIVVLERQSGPSAQGAGLQLSPNARVILDGLGLGPALLENAFLPRGIDVYPFRARRPVVTLELGRVIEERFGAPYAVMHRADLAQALHAACRRFANIEILHGAEAISVSTENGMSIESPDLKRLGRTARPFALIGADGVHSSVRRDTLIGPEATFSGWLAWRALLPSEAIQGLIDLTRTSLMLAPGHHMVAYPLGTGGMVNLVLFARAPTAPARGEEITGLPALPARVLDDPRIGMLVTRGGERWTAWPVHTVPETPWHRGAIGLVGDAAHAMLPFQAQGAAMAIEDAAVLGPLLAEADSAEAALKAYEAIRRPRVLRTAKVARANGRVFHMRRPFSLARDAVMRAEGPRGHLRRLGWLYGHRAGKPGVPPSGGR